ncbi:MAG: SCO family protein [Proteobacteria bacterium]|nr:SCO family protein [Pseudomonadota bacterium]
MPDAPPPASAAVTLPRLALAVALLAAAAAGALYARHRLGAEPAVPATQVAAVYGVPRALPAFALARPDGSRFDRDALLGHYTFVFFGYTNCPDLCPTTLTTLAAALRELGDLPARDLPAVVMVSVDPARDTPEVLGRYVPHFHPTFGGVTGSDEAVAAFAGALGAAFQRHPPVEGSYAVDHTAALFLIDPGARLLALFPTPHVADTIAADYRRIVGGAGRR